ncbi:hypothetical protein ACFLR1_00810 [Bacteroidota bacterium]
MRPLLIIGFLFLSLCVLSQTKPEIHTAVKDSSLAVAIFRVDYSAQFPTGDYASRFGFANNIGASVAYKIKKNWIFSLGGSYVFGNSVKGKNELLSELLTPSGIVIGSNGQQAYIDISQQGYMLNFQVGKIFPWVSPNPNSGFMFALGAGFYEYWIRYKAEGNTVPQLLGDYLKGYDRLTNGIILQEFVGYHFQGNSRMLNFYGGVEFTQGFTGNRRSYDIPTQSVLDKNYTDFLVGIKLGWMLPFYKHNQDKYYYD